MLLEPSISGFPPPAQSTTFDYDLKKSGLCKSLAFTAAMTSLALWFIWKMGAKESFHVILFYFPLLILSLSLSLLQLFQLSQKGPALTISTTGLKISNYSNDLIPWLDIAAVTRTRVGRVDFLNIRLNDKRDPAFKRSAPYKYFGWLMGQSNSHVTVQLRRLDCCADIPVKKIEVYLATARAARDEEFLKCGLALPIPTAAPALMNGLPWFTISATAFLCAVYFAEISFGAPSGPAGKLSPIVLDLFGGSNYQQVFTDRQWWRLFTAPLLHAHFLHILSNAIVLVFTGIALERFVGWRWTSAIFAVGALFGALGSTLLNPPHLVGVGASGGIMGLLAALVVLSYRLEPGPKRQSLQLVAGRVIAPALIPLAAHGTEHVDYVAHAFGGAAGVATALLIFLLWPRTRPEPRFARVAALFSLLFFCIGGGALAFSFGSFNAVETILAHARASGRRLAHPTTVRRPASEATHNASTTSSRAEPFSAVAEPPRAVSVPKSSARTQVGDFWRYDVRDEITGDIKKMNFIVTDVKPESISVRVNIDGRSGQPGYLTYDSDWNGLQNDRWKFSPSDGTGIPRKLFVGEAWSLDGDSTDVLTNHSRRRHLVSNIVGREALHTEAGTFNTYRIETTWTARDSQNAFLQFNYTQTTWYDSSINHWVKRAQTFMTNGLVRTRTTATLIAYGHRKSAEPLSAYP